MNIQTFHSCSLYYSLFMDALFFGGHCCIFYKPENSFTMYKQQNWLLICQEIKTENCYQEMKRDPKAFTY